MPAPYKVELRTGAVKGTVVGEMIDQFGWVVTIEATRCDDGVYRGTGELGPTPESLCVPCLDDAK